MMSQFQQRVLDSWQATVEQSIENCSDPAETVDWLLRGLRDAHDRLGYECVAHSEGQQCCVDRLIGET